MRGEQFGPERAEAGKALQRAFTAGDEGAFDGDDVLVEVGLERHTGVPGHLRDRRERLVGGDLGDRHGQGGVDEGLGVPPVQVHFGGGDHLGELHRAHSPAEIVADHAEHAAQADVRGDVGDRGDVDA